MAIAASKVKSLCTASEIALVRASRSPELEKLSPPRLKQMATRARTLANKWRDLGRGQSRASNRATGHAKEDSNTKLKEQIFREAFAAFEAQAKKADGAAKGGFRSSGKPTKKHRAVEHRTRRAAIRKGMTAATDLVNAAPAQKPAAAVPAAAATAPASVAATPATKSSRPAKTGKASRPALPALPAAGIAATLSRPAKVQLAPPATLHQAKIAAKKSRIARSGKTTRVLAHVKSRGKRVQARRDAKG